MRRLLVLAGVAGAFGACSTGAAPAHKDDPSALVATAPASDETVATVDGRPIHASDVATQMRATGASARVALDALVDAEVLAGAAVERGLLHDSDVVYARRAAEGRRLLAVDFDPRTDAAHVPEEELRRAYDDNKAYYDRGEIVEAQHIIAAAGAKAPPDVQAQSKAAIVALAARAKAAPTAEAFAALAGETAPGQFPLHTEQLAFPRTGIVEEPFAKAAFALGKPGDVSGPVETSYGWHLIRLVKKDPAKHVSFAAAHDELVAGVLPTWRKHQLEAFVRELVERWGAVEHAELLRTPESAPQ